MEKNAIVTINCWNRNTFVSFGKIAQKEIISSEILRLKQFLEFFDTVGDEGDT